MTASHSNPKQPSTLTSSLLLRKFVHWQPSFVDSFNDTASAAVWAHTFGSSGTTRPLKAHPGTGHSPSLTKLMIARTPPSMRSALPRLLDIALFSTFVSQAVSDFTGLFEARVVRRVPLTSNHPSGSYAGKILLGEVNDSVLSTLEAYSDTAAELVNTRNRKRSQGNATCHDWAAFIVRSLEDAMLLPKVCMIGITVAREADRCVL